MELNRRDFLKGAAATGGSAALLGLIGCGSGSASGSNGATGTGTIGATAASGTNSDIGVAQDNDKVSLDDAVYDVDIVVMGSGAAGLSAATEAAEQGGNVLLIEASVSLGGTTQFAEGILGVNTPIQQALGITNDIQKMVNAELEFSNYVANPLLIEDFLQGADEDIAWLQEKGVEFYTDVIGGTSQHLYVGQGVGMIKVLQATAEELSVEMLTGARGKRLFMNDGTVVGLVAEDSDGEFAIKTKAVILACGGYIQNDEMLKDLLNRDAERLKVTAAPNHFGDQITMAYAAGGDNTGTSCLHLIWAGLENFDLHSELSCAACNEPYFMINENGERFMNEGLLTAPSVFCNPILNQKRAISILSQEEVTRLTTEPCTIGWGSYIFAGTPLAKLQEQLDKAKEDAPEGFYFADTIEELATALEMEQATLSDTIKEYNEMCDTGADTHFFKPAPFLRKIPEAGPFYAFDLLCNVFCTMGGIRINRQNNVVDNNFNTIPGLYCAGVDCSGLQGTTYCIYLGGGAQGYAVYSGRNSARNAVAYAKA